MNTNNTIGNLTTIIKTILLTIFGYIIGALASKGLNLNIDETLLSQIAGAIALLIVAYLDSKYHNTFKFLNNNVESEEDEEDITIQ